MSQGQKRRIGLRGTIRVLAVLFTLTGCAGLLAEQCFEKLLTGLVGASTPAATIVLAVYFMGLTLGAVFYPKLRKVKWNPMRTYGFLEAGIGAWAVVLAIAYPVLIFMLTPVLRLGADHFWILQGLRFVAAMVWILPPTLLMGATFPAVVDILEGMRAPNPRKMMSRFYALNLLGAILGAILGPYRFFPSLGLVGTLLFTALVDLVVAGTILMLLRSSRLVWNGPPRGQEDGYRAMEWRKCSVLLGIGFFSGFLFFALEILWTHLIGTVLGNSVYAFAAMLTIVLTGLFFGGWLSSALFRERRPVSPFATSLLLLAGSLVLLWQYSLWDETPIQFIVWGGGLTTFGQGELLRWIQAIVLLLPASILFGMVYPSLFRMNFFSGHNRARLASLLSGVNSVGCVLGALACGFWMIPRFGSETTLLILGWLALVSGWALSLTYARGWVRGTASVLAILMACLWSVQGKWNQLALTSGGHVYFQMIHVTQTSQLHYFHEDSLGGITTVVYQPPKPGGQSTIGMKTLLTNGKFQANDAGEVHAQTGFAVVPILHVRTPQDALVIGLGSGHSAEIVKRFGFSQVDIAEISPGIVEGATKHFPHINGHVLEKPGVNLYLEDGRNVLLLHPRQYDLITMEISSIWFAGSTSLYCREFYDLCRQRLKPGGIMQQWIQVHHLGMEELGSVIATMHKVFPYVSFWMVGGQGILVGSLEPQKIQQNEVDTFFKVNPWGDPLPESLHKRLTNILATRLLAAEDVNHFLMRNEFEINTDSNRFLEYATPKYNLDRRPLDVVNVRAMSRFASFPPYLPEPSWPEAFRESATQITPKMQRQVLGLETLEDKTQPKLQ